MDSHQSSNLAIIFLYSLLLHLTSSTHNTDMASSIGKSSIKAFFLVALTFSCMIMSSSVEAARHLLQTTQSSIPNIPGIPINLPKPTGLPPFPSIPTIPQPKINVPPLPTDLPNLLKPNSLPPLPSLPKIPSIPTIPTTIPSIPFFSPPPN